MTKGSPIKLIVRFTIPLLIGNLVQQLYNFSDALVVGRAIGVNALAAVGATSGVISLIIGFAVGMTSGLGIPTAKAFGNQNKSEITRSFVTSIYITLGVSIIMTLFSYIFSRPLLLYMQTPSEIIDDAVLFSRVIFLGSGATMFYNLLNSQIRALGNSRTPLFFLVISCFINIILDLILVVGLNFGITGAAVSTVLAQIFSSVCCLLYIKYKIPELKLERTDFIFKWDDIRSHLSIALPMGFQQSIIAIGTVVLQSMLNTLGTTSIVAYTTASRIDQIAILPSASFGIAMATYTAQNLGAKKITRIRKGVHQTMILNCTLSLFIGLLIILFGENLVQMFVGPGQTEVLDLTNKYFLINSSMYWVLGILFTIRYTLQGLGKKAAPTLAGIFELFARIFAGLILIPSLGFLGAAMDSPLAWIGSVLVLIPSYIHVMKNLKTVEDNELLLSNE